MSTNAENLVKIGQVVDEIFGGICRFLPSHAKRCSCYPRNLWGYWTIRTFTVCYKKPIVCEFACQPVNGEHGEGERVGKKWSKGGTEGPGQQERGKRGNHETGSRNKEKSDSKKAKSGKKYLLNLISG